MVTDPVIAVCGYSSCQWEWPAATETERDHRKAQHEHLRHNRPLPLQELAGADWQSTAIDAVRKMAATGRDYTIHAALREHGVGDPPNAKTAMGRFSTLVHDLGYQQSERKGTKKSSVAVWNRDPLRCVDAECRRAAS